MLKEQIQSDLNKAQRARDELTVSTLRLLLSAIRYVEIEKQGELSEEEVVSLIQKEVKKRQEAKGLYQSGNRQDLALKEESESQILTKYLPAQLSDAELTEIVEATIKDMGAIAVSDIGKVIGTVMGKVAGKADGTRVSNIVQSRVSARLAEASAKRGVR